MESNKCFTAAEWYDFLLKEVKLPEIARDEIEKLAQKLAEEYMSKDDFISLSEDELKTTYKFERKGLLNQITRWKNSLQTGTTNSQLNNSNTSSSVVQQNPLLDIVEMLKTPINQNHIAVAQSLLTTNTKNVSQAVPNYLSAVNALETFGDNMVPESERVYYRCRTCEKRVWVAKGMSALVEFPACFNCQRDWLSGLCSIFQ